MIPNQVTALIRIPLVARQYSALSWDQCAKAKRIKNTITQVYCKFFSGHISSYFYPKYSIGNHQVILNRMLRPHVLKILPFE